MANTRMKDRNGNQVLLILVLFERYCAVNVDNFNAAAKPINIPKKEKKAMINPFRMPFINANNIKEINTISITIKIILILDYLPK